MKRTFSALMVSLMLCAWRVHAAPLSGPLPHLGVDKNSVTVSGLSAGGYMAVQLGVAYSEKIRGVGAVAGGIYNCALGKTENSQNLCMKTPEKIDVAAYVTSLKEAAAKGLIADPRNIAQQRVFILNGASDKIVMPAAGQKLAEFYQTFGTKPITEFRLNMGHGFPSRIGSTPCELSQFPWVNQCNYDGAKAILETLYGPLNPPSLRPVLGPWTSVLNGELQTFNQLPYNAAAAKMLDYGKVYIPQACRSPQSHCRLHVALHGCLQSPALVQDAFDIGAGYNEWAETNKIVVLYPATTASLNNPSGCWDWFGYTNADYAVRSSLQMKAIMKMVETLSAD